MRSALFRKAPLAWAVSLASAVSAQMAIAAEVAIEEVVVTAQKREQNLQETPIAITAVSQDTIETLGIKDVQNLNGMVPNLRVAPSQGAGSSATMSMRGAVTVNPALNLEPTVGMYINGIYYGKTMGAAFDVADMERIEVLRGPQGTLYGKNTTGGAINFVTKRPTGELGGKLTVGLGSDNLQRGKLDLNAPAIGEVGEGAGKLSTKISLASTRRDGLFDNTATEDGDFGNINNKSLRFDALWQPIDAVEALYSYDETRVDQHPQFFQLETSIKEDRQDSGSQDSARHDDANIKGHSLVLNWDAGNFGELGDLQFKSLTGYRKLDSYDYLDWDGTAADVFHSSRDISYDGASQEFQAIGKTERVNYVAGLYYLQEEGKTLNPGKFFIDIPTPTYGFDNDSWAVFGQAEWMPPVLEDKLRLTLGARYTEESKDVYRHVPSMAVNLEGKDTFENFSPMFVAAYQLVDQVNVYAKVAKGWKAGGFNAETSDVNAFSKPYKEEEVTSYEVGAKTQWLDNRLQANAAVFHDKHDNMQVSHFTATDFASYLNNAGKAVVDGAELEMIMLPVENLQLSLGYGYLDPDYKSYKDLCTAAAFASGYCAGGVAAGDEFEAKGINKFAYAPQHTVNASIEYTLPVFVGEVATRLDWSYVTDQYTFPDPVNYVTTQVDQYDLLDARISWRKLPVGENSEAAFSLWAKNLTDEEYKVNGLNLLGTTTMHYGDPRTIGVDATLTF